MSFCRSIAGGGGRAPGYLVLANRMKTKDKGGRPGHAPDDRSRQMVEVLSGFGIPTVGGPIVTSASQPCNYSGWCVR
jgi:hypothetical protein